MPSVDTTFIVGVLREWEKGLLEADEYTRIIEANTIKEAIHTLVDTPYGSYMGKPIEAGVVFKALDYHLQLVHTWLADKLADSRVLQFISARYDALNIGTCLVQYGHGAKEPGQLSALGYISADALHSSVWHGLGWDMMPEFWERAIKELQQEEFEPTILLEHIAHKAGVWLSSLAFTALMHQLVEAQQGRLATAAAIRPYLQDEGALEQEKQWDEEVMKIIKQYKNEPTGFDPIVAFWYAKELEVKCLRLLLTAKIAGQVTDEVKQLQRSLYRSLI